MKTNEEITGYWIIILLVCGFLASLLAVEIFRDLQYQIKDQYFGDNQKTEKKTMTQKTSLVDNVNDSDNNRLEDRERIYFDKDLVELFNARYEHEKLEFHYCLGRFIQKGDKSIWIDKIIPTEIKERTTNTLSFEDCPTRMAIHSHTSGINILSSIDLNELKRTEYNSMCIIFGKDKINCFNGKNEQQEVILNGK